MDDIRDIKPPLPLEGDAGWLWLLAGLAVLTGLAVWRHRRASPGFRAARALGRAVDVLEAQAPRLDDRTLYYRLADLLRQGLSRRLGLDACAMTTEELLPHLAASTLSPDLRTAVAALLARADPARYAALPPGGVVQEEVTPSWPPEASPFPSSSPSPPHPPHPRHAQHRQRDLATTRAVAREAAPRRPCRF